jgi:hypothetical protein
LQGVRPTVVESTAFFRRCPRAQGWTRSVPRRGGSRRTIRWRPASALPTTRRSGVARRRPLPPCRGGFTARSPALVRFVHEQHFRADPEFAAELEPVGYRYVCDSALVRAQHVRASGPMGVHRQVAQHRSCAGLPSDGADVPTGVGDRRRWWDDRDDCSHRGGGVRLPARRAALLRLSDPGR